MKYLKTIMTLFIVTLCLGLAGVSAREYTQISNVNVPIMSVAYDSKQVDKDNDWQYTQKVKKTYSKDAISNDGREISGRITGLFAGMITTGWKNLPLNSNIDFGRGTEVEGGWKVSLRSDKYLLTTAAVSVNWDLGTILYSPYGIKGTR